MHEFISRNITEEWRKIGEAYTHWLDVRGTGKMEVKIRDLIVARSGTAGPQGESGLMKNTIPAGLEGLKGGREKEVVVKAEDGGQTLNTAPATLIKKEKEREKRSLSSPSTQITISDVDEDQNPPKAEKKEKITEAENENKKQMVQGKVKSANPSTTQKLTTPLHPPRQFTSRAIHDSSDSESDSRAKALPTATTLHPRGLKRTAVTPPRASLKKRMCVEVVMPLRVQLGSESRTMTARAMETILPGVGQHVREAELHLEGRVTSTMDEEEVYKGQRTAPKAHLERYTEYLQIFRQSNDKVIFKEGCWYCQRAGIKECIGPVNLTKCHFCRKTKRRCMLERPGSERTHGDGRKRTAVKVNEMESGCEDEDADTDTDVEDKDNEDTMEVEDGEKAPGVQVLCIPNTPAPCALQLRDSTGIGIGVGGYHHLLNSTSELEPENGLGLREKLLSIRSEILTIEAKINVQRLMLAYLRDVERALEGGVRKDGDCQNAP